MKTRIELMPAFKIAGISNQLGDDLDLFKMWKKLQECMPSEVAESFESANRYQTTYMSTDSRKIKYLVGYDSIDCASAQKLGLEIVSVPMAEYIIVSLPKNNMYNIMKGWDYVTKEFFPKSGYIHAGTPDFERTHDSQQNSNDYPLELYIPIVKIN